MTNKIRVNMRSKPGLYEQYEGHIDIYLADEYLDDEEEIFNQAVRKLKCTTFPDRDRSMWKMTGWKITG